MCSRHTRETGSGSLWRRDWYPPTPYSKCAEGAHEWGTWHVWSRLRSGIGAGMGVPPPGYRFVHNLPNKPLTDWRVCKILKTNRIICKIFKTLELWFLWSLGRHKPEAGGFCLYLIIRPGVRSEERRVGKECRSRW